MLMSEKHRERMQKRAEKEMAKALAVDASIFGVLEPRVLQGSVCVPCIFPRLGANLCWSEGAGDRGQHSIGLQCSGDPTTLFFWQTMMARTMALWLRERRTMRPRQPTARPT